MPINETSKAIAEIAKTTGKGIELAEKVGGFISKVIGPACNQLGGIMGDWAGYFRYTNLSTIADKVERRHSRRKLQGKTIPIPPRFAIPILESASLEDDETLQDVWAKLIANSMDPHFKPGIHPGYIEIVKQMSPDEAIILGSFLKLEIFPILFSNYVPKTFGDIFSLMMNIQPSKQSSQVSFQEIHAAYLTHCENLILKRPEDGRVCFDNLLRLRIVELSYDFCKGETFGSFENTSISIPARNEFLRMTPFGQRFVTACIDEEPVSAEQL